MAQYLTLNPDELEVPVLHSYLLASVNPRPIAFASTLDAEGKPNLAPFSYFNVFSTRPPLLIFSPNRGGRTGQAKDTHLNLKTLPEVVINVVSYEIVQQMVLTSALYPPEINEFEKGGFTPLPSELVKPPRVAESPVQMECRMKDLIELGEHGGAGNLALCEVVRMHIKTEMLGENDRPDPYKMDLVGRMGGNWYSRAQGEMLFEVPGPRTQKLVGIDGLPQAIRSSKVLTGNELGMLANREALPTNEEVAMYWAQHPTPPELEQAGPQVVHRMAQQALRKGKVEEAWMLLLA